MELVLRTKAILNRTEGNVSFSKITIDQNKARVVCQGRKIAFSLIEYNLFNLLLLIQKEFIRVNKYYNWLTLNIDI